MAEVSWGDNEPAPAGYSSADKLVRKVDELIRARFLLERQWKINLAFYKGKQYVFYNRVSRRIESLPTDEGDKPRYRVRLVSNQIAPSTQALLSRLVKTKPQFYATPGQSSFEAQKASEVAENLLEFWWDSLDLNAKREEAVLWSIIAGTGFWKVSWDPEAGEGMEVMVSPEGQPIVDKVVERYFHEELEDAGIDPDEFRRRVFPGEVRIDVMSPFDVIIDDSARTFEDARFAFCIHPMSPKEVNMRFGVDLKANAINEYPDDTLPGLYGRDISNYRQNVRLVFYGYFLPSEKYPEGRFVVFTKDPNIILLDEKFPYPFMQLPLVKFPGQRVPGQIWDGSVVEQAVPIQKELNRTLSQMIEYKNLTLKPQMLAPVGSLRQRITDEPGAIFEYNPVAGKVPEAIPLPGLPSYVFEHLQDLGARLRDVFGLNEVLDGQISSNVEAGVAIDLLQEAATDRLAPQILMMEKSLEKAGNMLLMIAQKYYSEPRMLIINGSGSKPKVERFESADLLAGVQVRVESGSGLPRTRAGRQARVLQLMQMGVLSPSKAYKYLDMADFKNLQAQFQADEDQALREHDKLIDGEGVINEQAAKQAEQMVFEALMNPQIDPVTGDIAELDPAIMEQAATAGLQPLPYENKAIHLDTHGAFMKSPEFEVLDDAAKERFYNHYELTLQAQQAEDSPQGDPPKVSLQLRGAVGPTTGSKILNQSGVQGVTPEEMLEEPLDTVVIDNKDKPNAEDAVAALDQQRADLAGKLESEEAMHQQRMRQEAELQTLKLNI
jgi:hypothetical protein